MPLPLQPCLVDLTALCLPAAVVSHPDLTAAASVVGSTDKRIAENNKVFFVHFHGLSPAFPIPHPLSILSVVSENFVPEFNRVASGEPE